MAAAAYQQQQQGAPHLGLGYTAAIEGSTSLGSSYGTARHEQGQHELGPSAGGQFGVLELTDVPRQQQQQPGQEQQQEEGAGLAEAPPDLATWRARLFDVGSRGETLVLSSAEYATYFPHVDNVYSHRSTQRYKRRSFVSHYWDCRMKGRPSGTAPGAGDPNRRKRKRAVRERDLCDVKIKIVEYAGGARVALGEGHVLFSLAAAVPGPQGGGKELQVAPGDTVWTIQRVNGNGGNGRAGGVAGPHRHTLQQSDAIKRNSVQRMQARREREAKKTQRPTARRATEAALATTRRRARECELKLYGSCFCPLSQRVWIALEAKGLAYQYCEADASRGPAAPVLQHGDWTCDDSGVILEYLEDVDPSIPLMPSDARRRAKCRTWIQHINARIAPAFYAVLDHDAPSAALQTALHELTAAADAQGPFFLGEDLSLVDVHLAPFALRLSRILGPLRGWTTAPSGTRWQRWVDALEADKNVEATTSGRQLYLETTDLLLRRQTQDTGVGGGVPGGGGAEPGLVSGPAPAPGT